MRKGNMDVEVSLDLHGLTQDAAYAELKHFILEAYAARRRCVLIITGRGMREGTGILRSQVPRWLNEPPIRDRILGLSQARPRDGGEGALYVLIRRQR